MSARRIATSSPLLATLLLVACTKSAGAPAAKEPEPALAATESDAPPAKELWASIDIVSSPAGMEALVDGKSVGKTPTRADKLKPGHYDVTFKDEANGDATYGVDIGEGESQLVKHSVVPRADRPAPANAKQ